MGKITIQSDKRVEMKNNDNQQATPSNLFKKKKEGKLLQKLLIYCLYVHIMEVK